MLGLPCLLAACLLLSCGTASSLPGEEHWLKRALLKDVNGGTGCAVCTVLIGLVDQLTEIHNVSVAKAMDMFCHFLPEELQNLCIDLVAEVAPVVIVLLEERYTPDVVCYALDVCKNDTGEFCRLFPQPKLDAGETIELRVTKAKSRVVKKKKDFFHDIFIDICKIPEFERICNALNDHIPFEDEDGDSFSTEGTLRGFYWRGKDCNDTNKEIYPGRHVEEDVSEDANCNGIYGMDPDTNVPYEKEWCLGTQQMGTIVLGDSASAHFHIPPSWVTSKDMSPEDYQNVAWNGARASAMAAEVAKAFARNGADDNPVFLSLALIGNDVCNGHPSMDHMTKPEDFYRHILETLKYVDQTVAPGSIVIGMGLVDGRVLYELLADRIHPIGSLRNDVTYSAMYDYLNCLQISPCFGWMNSNGTWRNRTTERALLLNKAYQQVIANNTFENFKIFYIDPPLPQAIKRYKEEGRRPWELIEPVDGFHPSQAGDALTTELVFQILANLDGALPKLNPNNAKIKAKFGDQGGYGI